jgi:hypothetical protein
LAAKPKIGIDQRSILQDMTGRGLAPSHLSPRFNFGIPEINLTAG